MNEQVSSEANDHGSMADQTWDDLVKEGDATKIRDRLQDELAALLKKRRRSLQGYSVVILYLNGYSLRESETDRIYEALDNLNPNHKNDVLLIMVSNGGQIEPAYHISKICREYSRDKFVVVVPKQAKSAATMIALGADEVHMGLRSELGPVDPQINGRPGLALRDALEWIANMTEEKPGSAPIWPEIIDRKIPLSSIGYYERIAESAVDYAYRLLIAGKSNPERAKKIAWHLVHGYKDHGFVIDRNEAKEIFGDSVVFSSAELSFGEEVYRIISKVDNALKEVISNDEDDEDIEYVGVTVVGALHDGVILHPQVPRSFDFPSML